MEFGYAENVDIITIGEMTLVMHAEQPIPMNLMYGFVHVVTSIIGKTGIATDAIANMKDECMVRENQAHKYLY